MSTTCKTHLETSREYAHGCHRVEHSWTLGERIALRARPYKVCPLSQVHAIMPNLRTEDGVRIFHFQTREEMPTTLKVTVPPTLCLGNTITINLLDTQQELAGVVESSSMDGDTEDPFESEWNGLVDDDTAIHTRGFVPFALVVYTEATPDEDRSLEYQSAIARPCSG